MSYMKTYLEESGKTEAMAPEGKVVSKEVFYKMIDMLTKFEIQSENLDILKKHVMYGRDLTDEQIENLNLVIDPTENNAIAEEEVRLLHAIMGMVTEIGEVITAISNRVVAGTPLDRTNIIEELGDFMWYQAILLRMLDSDFESCAKANLNKLLYGKKARYKSGGFSSDEAINRDTVAEREQLESDIEK